MTLSIALLGPPRVERDGMPVSFDTRKAMALLAHLAIAERARARESLCELLWPSHAPDRSRGALRRTLSTLRSGVGEEWLETAGDTVAVRRGEGFELDVDRFRGLVGGGAPPDELEQGVALFAGDFMEGFGLRDSAEFDLWQSGEADGLRRELGAALGRLVGSLSAAGEDGRALPHAQRRLALDPLHEPAHRDLIGLLARTGERAAAFDQYRECVRVLSRELGVPPTDETAALFEQLSEGGIAAVAIDRPGRPRLEPAAPPAQLPLVGRDAELTHLTDLQAAAAPDGSLAVIEGEAGIGKTRLASELVARARGSGAAVLTTRCHEDESGVPFGAIAELLRGALASGADWTGRVPPSQLADAALLVPELGDPSLSPSPQGPGARARLLEAVAGVLSAAVAGDRPGLIALDDLHVADEATLDAVSYLARRLAGRPLLLAVTWRSEGVPAGHRLRRLAADLSREGGAASIRLGRLTEPEVAELVRTAAPDTDAESGAFRESEGLPLFVSEYLAVLRTGGEAGITAEVRDLLGARVAALPATTHQVLGAAAVIGRSFDLDIAREASGRADDETVVAIDELLGRGIVTERAVEPAYEFSHEKLRELVLSELSRARARLLHGRVAHALAARPHPASDAAVIAQHLRLAGDSEAAAGQYRLAGEHAAAVHAHSDAVEHFDTALALGDPDIARLHERIGDLRTLMGDYAAALAAYETAAAQTSAEHVASVERKLGAVHHRRGEWDRAEARLRTALASASDDDRALRARIRGDLSLTLQEAGRAAEAAVLAREALALAEAADDQPARAQAHNLLGMLAREAGELNEARGELGRSLELAEEIGAPEPRVAALNNLALALAAAGEDASAVELTERALELCAGYGDRHREAALHNNLADLHHAADRDARSMEHLKRAVAIFSEVGADEDERLPGVWKLVAW